MTCCSVPDQTNPAVGKLGDGQEKHWKPRRRTAQLEEDSGRDARKPCRQLPAQDVKDSREQHVDRVGKDLRQKRDDQVGVRRGGKKAAEGRVRAEQRLVDVDRVENHEEGNDPPQGD